MNKRASTAFTLVELLVVIGIIAVLIGILLPSLARARSNAASVQCLSNLRSQGQAVFIYANQNKGYLPTAFAAATIYRFPQFQAESISRILRGNTKVFYCPVNEMLAPGTQAQITPDDFYPPDHNDGVWDTTNSGRILYWWLANPNTPDYTAGTLDANGFPTSGSINYRDVNGNGSVRDEYVRRLGERGAPNVVICTDWSGQLAGTNRGWTFIHGKTTNVVSSQTVAQGKGQYRCWKNNLYGDGHAASVRPDEVQWRWGKAGPACW